MFEAKFDQLLNQFVVAPLFKDVSNDYLIICSNENDAKSLCAQIVMQMIPSPVDNPLKYFSKGIHQNGRTKIFQYK